MLMLKIKPWTRVKATVGKSNETHDSDDVAPRARLMLLDTFLHCLLLFLSLCPLSLKRWNRPLRCSALFL